MSNYDDFWTTLAAANTNTVLVGSMDTHLSGKAIGESFGAVRDLTDRVREANALALPVDAGTKVVFAGNLGAYMSYDDVPANGITGEVVTVKSATGDITHHDGKVFVKWADGKFRPIHAEHLRLAGHGKTTKTSREKAPKLPAGLEKSTQREWAALQRVVKGRTVRGKFADAFDAFESKSREDWGTDQKAMNAVKAVLIWVKAEYERKSGNGWHTMRPLKKASDKTADRAADQRFDDWLDGIDEKSVVGKWRLRGSTLVLPQSSATDWTDAAHIVGSLAHREDFDQYFEPGDKIPMPQMRGGDAATAITDKGNAWHIKVRMETYRTATVKHVSRAASDLKADFEKVKALAEKRPDSKFLKSLLKQMADKGFAPTDKQMAVVKKIEGEAKEMATMQKELKSLSKAADYDASQIGKKQNGPLIHDPEDKNIMGHFGQGDLHDLTDVAEGKEGDGNLKAAFRVASLGDLTDFLRVAEGALVHKSTRDLWSYGKDADGNYLVSRLFDDEGEPLKA